jgi:hypothetical protein
MSGAGRRFWQDGPESRWLPEPQPFGLLHGGWYDESLRNENGR